MIFPSRMSQISGAKGCFEPNLHTCSSPDDGPFKDRRNPQNLHTIGINT
jgi:hypothetical protein